MVKRIIIVLISISVIILSPIYAYAEDSTIPDEYGDLLDSLPDDITETLPEGIYSNNEDEALNAIHKMSSWEYISEKVIDIININFNDAIKALAALSSLIILSSILRSMINTFNNTSISKALRLVSNILVVVALIEISKTPLEKAVQLLDRIRLFVNSSSPLICTMYAMGGNVNKALVHNYGFLVFLSVFENICIMALEMILGVCISLTLASTFISDGNLISLSKSIKKAFTSFIGIIMVIFTAVISTQSLLASKADSLSAKTGKVIASQMIPIVGGTVGDSLKAIGASIEYIRSYVGVSVIIIFLLTVLPTIISLYLYRLSFIISNSLAGLLGCDTEGGVIAEISGIYGYAIAILVICSVALLFLLVVFVMTRSAIS